jgi:hypothetical protein
MSETAAQVLASFDLLPPHEKQLLLIELLRRTEDLPQDRLTEEQMVELADNLFQELDARETDD